DDIESLGHCQDVDRQFDIKVCLHRAVGETLERLRDDAIRMPDEMMDKTLTLELCGGVVADRRVCAGPHELPPAREVFDHTPEVEGDVASLGGVNQVGHVDEDADAW